MRSKKTVALLVHTCDRYAFLYQGFEYFFRKHWDFNIPCTYYFATEETDADIHGFKTIKSGKGEWANRLHFLLNKKIEEDYVLYFQEDMWLCKNVYAPFFKELFDMTVDNHWKQVKLDSSEVYTTIPTDRFIQGYNIARLDNAASGFLMSHQATLWDKQFLMSQLYKDEHPWRNERLGTKRLKKLDPEIFHVDYFAFNGKPEINDNPNPVGRGEYMSVSINATLDHSILPFIKELASGNESDQKYAQQLQYNYDHQLTHDGKAKPRNAGLFNKFKNWLHNR